MPITELDHTAALVVIDLQKGVVGIEAAHPVPEIVARSRQLLDSFRAHHLPVVLVNVSGAPGGRTDAGRATTAGYPDGWDELIDDLDQHPSDHLVTKYSRGAFTNTGLHEKLAALGVTQVFVIGIATGSGVEATARQAHEYGYNVALVTDAMTDRSIDVHEHSVRAVFPRIAETGTTADVLELLAARS
ncbi:MAG: isochorismatase family cysteine hydrolase [Actinomycetota bacterium]